jgi:hypothetical protein
LCKIITHMNWRQIVLCLCLLASATSTWADDAENTEATIPFFNLKGDPSTISNQHILEFWGYHAAESGDTTSNTLKLRYYQPLQYDQWRGTMRIDTSYVDAYGPLVTNQNPGHYSAGNTMLTLWGNHPGFLSSWDATLGGRVIFPFGNNSQWAVGPQVGMVFLPTSKGALPLSDFSPLARYMYGFYAKNQNLANAVNQQALARRLELYPTLGFNLAPDTQLRLWDENGMVYNSAGGGWFVPIDGMVTHRLNKHFLIAVGASKQVVQTYQQYNWQYYGKLSFNF